MKVLLSIKPEFAYKIFSGEKTYEYRKCIFKEKVDTIVVYASKPVGKILGELFIEDILEEDPLTLWDITGNQSGITEDFFMQYFAGRQKAYAIKVSVSKRYKKPIDPYKLDQDFTPPQSFCYC